MDARHPQHNPAATYGWIRRGQVREIRTNMGRRRVNINGVIDLERLDSVVRLFDSPCARLDGPYRFLRIYIVPRTQNLRGHASSRSAAP